MSDASAAPRRTSRKLRRPHLKRAPGSRRERPASAQRTPQLMPLLRCTHPRQALGLALLMGVAAALTGRPAGEVAIAAGAVLLAQLIAGLLNDYYDEFLDRHSQAEGKPIAAGVVPRSNATFAAAALLLPLIPMSLQNGSTAGIAILLTVVAAWLHNRTLRRTPFSFLAWALSGGLFVIFLAYGGWGLGRHGSAASPLMIGLGALAGICLHFATSLPDLVNDNRAGIRPLPLVVALKVGAPRLLILTAVVSVAVTVAIVIVGLGPGLHG